MAKPLSVHELEDLRNWTVAALEDDPTDDFPRLVLRLLDENAELRLLLYGAKESGQLALVDRLSHECAELRAEVQRLRTGAVDDGGP